jgi:hypothetical protein
MASRMRVLLTTSPSILQRRHAIHGEIVLLPHLHEQVDVAFAFVAEIPGVADRDAAQWSGGLHQLLNEISALVSWRFPW